MITKTIIKLLRNDSQIQTLLGVASANACPIFTTFNYDENVSKQINLSFEYGESVPFDQETAKTHDGRVRVYILVKDSLSGAVNTTHQIANRVLQLLDLKGTTLDTASTVYWVQKLDADFTHYEDIHFYELMITFRFVIKEP
jgi:hypothetical protein